MRAYFLRSLEFSSGPIINSVFSAAVNPRRNFRSIATLHLFFKIKCCVDRLRPPGVKRTSELASVASVLQRNRSCGSLAARGVAESDQAAAKAARASSIHPVAFISSKRRRARSISARSSCVLSPRRKRP